jgi:AraC-like DNA-binding protein
MILYAASASLIFYQSVKREIKSIASQKTASDCSDHCDAYQRPEKLMNIDRLYTHFEINLQTVSEMLGDKSHRLSSLLNKDYGTSFKDYVNKYRIDKAVRLLTSDKGLSITSICYNVAFGLR